MKKLSNPLLNEAVDAFRFVITASKDGSVAPEAGKNIAYSAHGIVRAVQTDVLQRIAPEALAA